MTHAVPERLLIVELPRSAHEIPLTELNRTMVPIIEKIPYDSSLIRPSVEMNLLVNSLSGDFDGTPDMAILLARQSGRRVDSEVVFLAECAFSQGKEALRKKLQLEVDARPELVMVIMIIITEAPRYHSPKEDSTAWHTFRHHSTCCTFTEFADMIQTTDEDHKWLGSITVADHVWSHVSNVDYYVWVNDGEKIRIDERDGPTMACGVSEVSKW